MRDGGGDDDDDKDGIGGHTQVGDPIACPSMSDVPESAARGRPTATVGERCVSTNTMTCAQVGRSCEHTAHSSGCITFYTEVL